MKDGESIQQKHLFKWIRLKALKDWRYDKIYHIPNGGLRAKTTAINLKLEGAKAGVWDIFVPIPKDGFSGMYIEMNELQDVDIVPIVIDSKEEALAIFGENSLRLVIEFNGIILKVK